MAMLPAIHIALWLLEAINIALWLPLGHSYCTVVVCRYSLWPYITHSNNVAMGYKEKNITAIGSGSNCVHFYGDQVF